MATGWILRETKPSALKDHPVNLEIYGEPPIDSEMLASVKEFGVLEPPRATKDGVILSGHRRKQHALAAKTKVIPVLFARHAISEPEQVIEIVESNRQREKTMEQRAREFSHLAEAKAALARKRMLSGKRADPSPNSDQGAKGRSDAQAAKEVGLGKNTARMAAAVVQKIDEAEHGGNPKRAAELRNKLNNESVSAAHRAAIPQKSNGADSSRWTNLPTAIQKKVKNGEISVGRANALHDSRMQERISLPDAIDRLNEIPEIWPIEQMDVLPAKLRKLADQIEKGLKNT